MKIAIYGGNTERNKSRYIELLLQRLSEVSADVYIYKPLYEFLEHELPLKFNYKTFEEHADLIGTIDYLFSIGGDGTFLSTLNFIKDSGIPVLGINTGRLGFLANVAQTEIDMAIDALMEKKFHIEKRILISVEQPSNLFEDFSYGLNEFTISKKNALSMITTHTYINGEYLNSYFGDGLIIATPTGSTAYSMSCGGPLVMPGSENFIITPIAPHNLNVRPLVISDNNIITLKMESRNNQYLASIDSKVQTVDASIEITLKKADFHINLIQLENQNFFNTIRNKLLWGAHSRQ